ncbi:hypothetical protein Celgi_1290 [Cellulomonas gilvus ATCC 13127]|uniref:Uncharacterized protein n=1 Tax=Cellulomonas gilvus (strain ATCC 13127 / NRRL B-14078) TaxID=593907 RepID=F8A2F2_CELGA|nr:hypothetical protein Celgi_1290 [Cellulomonas gilvus ATCC 13127]
MVAYVTTPDSTVRADLGAGLAEVEAADWAVERDLSGTALPGQVRAATGFAVGSGQVVIRDAAARTPWSTSRILPGGSVEIDADPDGNRIDDEGAPIARMVATAMSSPSAHASERMLDLVDDITSMRAPVTVPSSLLVASSGTDVAYTDAAWVIFTAARAGGRHAVPPPVPSAILAASLCGSAVPEVGGIANIVASGWQWDTGLAGKIGAVEIGADLVPTSPIAVGSTTYFTWTSSSRYGWSSSLHVRTVTGGSYLHLLPLYGTFRVAASGGSEVFGTWDRTANTVDEWRVEFRVERLSSTQTRVSLRGINTAPWSTPVTLTHPAMGDWTIVNPESMNGLQVTTADDPALFAAPSAYIAASGSPLDAIVGVGQRDAWDLIQEVAAATMGAVWIDELGHLIYRARDTMRGAGASSGTVTADGVVDLPWSISTADVADRVEVTYQPANIATSSTYGLTVWQADAAIRVPAGKTVQVIAQLESAAASDFAPFYALWAGPTDTATYSRWAAATSASGGGASPASGALVVTIEPLSTTQVRLSIRNTTATTLWTVDGTGAPTLVLRANVHATPGEAVTIAAGAAAEVARNALSVNLGPWVQDAAVAAEMLDWLRAMTSTPAPMLEGVEVMPDSTIRLGDVRTLVDPTYTGISTKVLVAGTRHEASPGALALYLRLVVLSTMFDDLDRFFVAEGITTFDQLDTYLISQGVTTFDDLDNYLLRLGGL